MPRPRYPVLLFFALCSVASFADRQEPHSYDLLDVNWHIAYDANARTIHGEVVNTIVLKGKVEGSVWFDCGPLTIADVEVDGKEASSGWRNEKLTVDLPSSAHPGQKLKIKISYSGSPTAGVYFVDAEHAYPANVGMVYTQGEAEDN